MTRSIETTTQVLQTVLKKDVVITARKFDNSIHRQWTADLVKRQDSLLVFVGEFDEEIAHPQLGLIERGTVSREYYWLDRWFNVFCFYKPNGEFRNYYCNINLPPTYEKDTLDYIDLDIDVLVQKDLTYKILDQNEFKKHSVLYKYPDTVTTQVNSTLAEILKLIEKRRFPFDQ